MRTECVADVVTPNSFIALFSPPESFELFYICKAFSINTTSDMVVDDYRHIIQKGDKYIDCNYLEKVKEKHGHIYYKCLSKTVFVLPAQVLLHYRLHCSCFILFPSVHSSSHSFHLPQSISFMFTLFGCIHITWSFNLIVSFTFQRILSLEISDLRVPLDNFLILDRYSLLKAGLRCFCNSLSLCIKQEIQQNGFT